MATDFMGGPDLIKSQALQKYEVKAKKSRFWKWAIVIDISIVILSIILKDLLKETGVLIIPWHIVGGIIVGLLTVSMIWFGSFQVSKSFDVKYLTLTAKYLEDKIAYQNKRKWSLYDRLDSFKQQGITTSYDKHENLVKNDVTEKLGKYEVLRKEIKTLTKEYFGKEI